MSNLVKPWSWVVLAASFLAMFLNGSYYLSVGVIHSALLDKYPEVDKTTVSWFGALFTSMVGLTGVLGSVIINIYNVRICVVFSCLLSLVGFGLSGIVTDTRWLFFTYGILAGSGQSICYTACMVEVGYYFKHKSSIATGIVTSSSGLSLFVFPSFSQYLIDLYGLSGTFWILGAICFQAAVFGCLMRPTEYEQRSPRLKNCRKKKIVHQKESETLLRDSAIRPCGILTYFRSSAFCVFLTSSMCYGVGVSTVYLNLPAYFKLYGSSSIEAAFITSVAGITGILSRLLLGFLASVVDVVIVYAGTAGITSILTLCMLEMTSTPGKFAYAALFGMYTGGFWSIQHTIVVELMGISSLATTYGITLFCTGIGLLAGPPLAELIKDHFKLPVLSFIFAGVFFFLASLSGIFLRVLKRREIVTVMSGTVGQREDNITEKTLINESVT